MISQRIRTFWLGAKITFITLDCQVRREEVQPPGWDRLSSAKNEALFTLYTPGPPPADDHVSHDPGPHFSNRSVSKL